MLVESKKIAEASFVGMMTDIRLTHLMHESKSFESLKRCVVWEGKRRADAIQITVSSVGGLFVDSNSLDSSLTNLPI